MKNIFSFILLLTMLVSLIPSSYASCLDRIDDSLKEQSELIKRKNSGAPAFAVLFIPLTFAFPVLFGSVLGIGAGDHIYLRVKRKNLKKLKIAIESAYIYIETGVAKKYLKKIKRKIERKTGTKISMEKLAYLLIDNNESEKLCEARSMTNYSRSLIVNLND